MRSLAMDRHGVRDSIASRIETLIRRLQPYRTSESEPSRINRLGVARFEAKVILDESRLMEQMAELEAELARKDVALRLIAYGDAQDWPGCSSRKVAEAALSSASSDGEAA